MTLLLTLLALLLLAATATAPLLHAGGRGCPPRSHQRDDRFLPPSSLIH